MKVKAYAKINLTLDVLGSRKDGYHEVNSVMQQVDLHDELNFEKFINYIAKGRIVLRVYYYNVPLDRKKDEESYIKQQKFFDKLKSECTAAPTTSSFAKTLSLISKVPSFKIFTSAPFRIFILGNFF